MLLPAGKLDRRIRIEKAGGGDDGYNETDGWAELATVWAWYIPTTGKEAREQLGREALLPASFRIRWWSKVADLAPGEYRLRFPAKADGQVWDIKSVTEIGRREGLEIVALARSGATV